MRHPICMGFCVTGKGVATHGGLFLRLYVTSPLPAPYQRGIEQCLNQQEPTAAPRLPCCWAGRTPNSAIHSTGFLVGRTNCTVNSLAFRSHGSFFRMVCYTAYSTTHNLLTAETQSRFTAAFGYSDSTSELCMVYGCYLSGFDYPGCPFLSSFHRLDVTLM